MRHLLFVVLLGRAREGPSTLGPCSWGRSAACFGGLLTIPPHQGPEVEAVNLGSTAGSAAGPAAGPAAGSATVSATGSASSGVDPPRVLVPPFPLTRPAGTPPRA